MAEVPPFATKWDQYLYWCARFHGTNEFTKDERNYKIPLANRLVSAREALLGGDSQWVELVRRAIHYRDGEFMNNLTDWRQTQTIEQWFQTETDSAALALRLLWNDSLPVRDRFNQFAEIVTAHKVKAPISETAFLHMAMGIEEFPPFRSGRMEMAMELTGWPTPKDAGIKVGNMGFRYQHFLQFLDAVVKRGRERGVEFRDRLDAQSATWCVTDWDPLPTWSDGEKRAFLAYQGKPFTPRESSA